MATRQKKKKHDWTCYLLANATRTATYVGATCDVDRRLRQHNALIAGGARYTTRGNRGPWHLVCCVRGFPSWSRCLSFEWHVKRQRPCGGRGLVDRRCQKLLRTVAEDPDADRLEVVWWPSEEPPAPPASGAATTGGGDVVVLAPGGAGHDGGDGGGGGELPDLLDHGPAEARPEAVRQLDLLP